MKYKMPLFFIIPGIAVAAVVGLALFFRVMPGTPAPVSAPGAKGYPYAIGNTAAGKPKSYLGNLFGGKQNTPTPTPVTANDLSTELKNTYDDGGASDITSLQNQANGL